jgi:hypothetical protein
MKKIFKIDESKLKPKRGMSPIISGVNRAPRILLIPGDCSSGIKAYEGGR